MGMTKQVVGQLSPEQTRRFAELNTYRMALEATLKSAMQGNALLVAEHMGRWNEFWAEIRATQPAALNPACQIDTATGEMFVVAVVDDPKPELVVDNDNRGRPMQQEADQGGSGEPEPAPEAPPPEAPPVELGVDLGQALPAEAPTA